VGPPYQRRAYEALIIALFNHRKSELRRAGKDLERLDPSTGTDPKGRSGTNWRTGGYFRLTEDQEHSADRIITLLENEIP
jgi:hypothetical protein